MNLAIIEKRVKIVALYPTKKLLHNKGSHQQNEKATHKIGENTCKSYIDMELISKR